MALTCMATPASALTFGLISDGSAQYLTWLWEGCTGGCFASQFDPCGNVSSVDGRIPLTGSRNGLAAGMLDWTGASDSLKVVAMTAVRSFVSTATGCQGAWAALDARTDPTAGTSSLVFSIAAEPGDPAVMDLQIRPRLLGTIFQQSAGGSAWLLLQLAMSVAVNGRQVSRDSLYADLTLSGAADSTWSLAFPAGTANYVVVPGVTTGSQVSVTLWAYMRAYISGPGGIDGSGPYGNGPAIEVLARPTSAVAVLPEGRPVGLWLGVRPNPSPGSTHILYALPRPSQLRLSVYDIAGSRVATLVDRIEDAGRGELLWNARDSRGERLAPGVYMVELVAGLERTVGKLVILGQ